MLLHILHFAKEYGLSRVRNRSYNNFRKAKAAEQLPLN